MSTPQKKRPEGTIALNNYLQGQGRVDTLVWSESTTGPKHGPQWTCLCKIEGEVRGIGKANTKQAAREIAAHEALQQLLEIEGKEQPE